MTALDLIRKYTEFNVWANQQMSDWLEGRDQSLMEAELKSSFPTINKTLAHIWFGEHIWMKRILGQPFENINLVCEGKPSTFICEGLLHQSREFAEFAGKLTEEDASGMVKYKLMSGESSASPVVEIIHHIMNHGSYHRGQLVTMGRELGFTDPPKTDFIHFCRLKI